MKLKSRFSLKLVLIGLTMMFPAIVVSTALAFPIPIQKWLSKPSGLGNSIEAEEYYNTIDAPPNLGAWKARYGFAPGAAEIRATYFNAGDLGFGRDMHCRRNENNIACYLVNHGFGPGSPAEPAVEAAIAGQSILATVAMVYDPALDGQPNAVSFYVYDKPSDDPNENEKLLKQIALDSDGPKAVPQLCVPCHGGSYNSATNSVRGASFLPFDAPSYKYSQKDGYTLADQQEAFRELNALVRDTNPASLITELVDGWYAPTGGVDQPGSTLDDHFVPPAYAVDSKTTALYNQVFKPSCRMCHVAHNPVFAHPGVVTSGIALPAVFFSYIMPHAEVTLHNFWSSSAPAFYAHTAGWSWRVTRLDDPKPDGCKPGDCSLREAIIEANKHNRRIPNSGIITFAVDGTFRLTRQGKDDSAAAGDLDITRSGVTILGNGAGKTIIDGGFIDRVFHIIKADVLIQGVTIQHGRVSVTRNRADYGGGILNDKGELTLNYTFMKDNSTADRLFGNAIYNDKGVVEINNSTFKSLGGIEIDNSGSLTLNNSTMSARSGILNSTGQVSVSNSTLNGIENRGTANVSIKNSIVHFCIGGRFNSLGYNLVGARGTRGGCPTIATDKIPAGDINTVFNTTLIPQEGGVPHHALLPGSPALDAIPLGDPNCVPPSYDQRGVARPLDGDGDGQLACDIGASEGRPALNVTIPDDLTADDGHCSLREAVTALNTGLPSGQKSGECYTDATVRTINLAASGPYQLTQGQLTVNGIVPINGNGRTIQGLSENSRVVEVTGTGLLSLRRVRIRGGQLTGGGSDEFSGGGIRINPGGVANILDSAVLENHSSAWGGGIANQGTLNIANSTIAGNTAAFGGGGINNRGTGSLTHVTITGNTADRDNDDDGNGGGVNNAEGGSFTIKNSLIAGNVDAPESGGQTLTHHDVSWDVSPIVSADYNLIGDSWGTGDSFNQPHDRVDLNPRLGNLTGEPAYS